jgi:hypothetical protein
MLKKIITTGALILLTAVLIFGAINRTLAKTSSETGRSTQGGQGHTRAVLPAGQETTGPQAASPVVGQGAGAANLADLPLAATPTALSADESAGLIFMREEEKLAYDVYSALSARWNLRVFQNISRSEQTHTAAVKNLLDRYGVKDPASSSAGVFTNPDLQKLYTDLAARGSQSVVEALRVGAAIEEIDILDLQKRLAQTSNPEIQQVYNNLLNGSYNHLRAFTNQLNAQTGATYQPQYLTPEAYQAILSATQGGGFGRRNGQGNGNRQGWNNTQP